ncbi:hypothetical protein AO499_08880 [Oenococcus oeni]|uniref:BglG family transcription antiterminator n=1 Tax=Oenococcus oeni TaxID=1247 RepID=UPI000BDEB77C|nr:HTH domain-containing protein [Oenococcus oeni]PDH77525.1 hypothetical protein AO499_08880 [Oenococcus oeni]
MILLSNRQKKILTKLYESDNGIILSRIAASLNISRRTVYREFSELRIFLQEHGIHIENSNGYYYLKGSNEDLKKLKDELQLQNKGLNLTTKQREDALLCLLLLENDGPVKIFSLALSLGVSEGTVQRDLKRFSTSLKESGITILKKKAVGVDLVGKESQIRSIACEILISEINGYDFFKYLNSDGSYRSDSFFLKLLPKEILSETANALKNSSVLRLSWSSDLQEIELILIITISIMRMKKHSLKKYAVHNFDENFFSYRQRVLEIFKNFTSDIKENITMSEINFIAMQIRELDYKLSPGDWEANYDVQVSFNVKQLIQNVSKDFHWNFSKDSDLFRRLDKHMVLLLYSKNKNFGLPNENIKILNNASVQYSDLYKILNKSLNNIFSEYIFNETEKQLILLYFANSYINNQTANIGLSALVICPNGIGAASILKCRLSKEIPEISEIRIAKISQLNNIQLDHFDIILSTVTLSDFDKDYQVVSPLLLSDEVLRIKKFISTRNLRYENNVNDHKSKKNDFKNKQKKLIDLVEKADFSQQLLDNIHLKLLDNHEINESLSKLFERILSEIPIGIIKDRQKVTKKILERINMSPVGIPDSHLSLAHATDESITSAFFSVYELTNPIEMMSMNRAAISVKRVLLMLGPTSMPDFQNNLMSKISSTIVMNNQNISIFENGSEQQIKNLVATQFIEQLNFWERDN